MTELAPIEKFRKKPIIIEAIQWNGPENHAVDILQSWGCPVGPDTYWDEPEQVLHIPTLEGMMRCVVGDWIIKGIKGEFYPCKPDIFTMTYELIDLCL